MTTWLRNTAYVTLLFFILLMTSTSQVTSQTITVPEGYTLLTLLYPPEFNFLIPDAISNFNQAYNDGIDPVTREPLASGEQRIYVVGYSRSSGRVMEEIATYMNTGSMPDEDGFYSLTATELEGRPPIIWIPAVGHWLDLVNHASGGTSVYDRAEAASIARTAVVIAIWGNRLDALASRLGKTRDQITLSDLLQLLRNGWDVSEDGVEREEVFYGRTNPFVSSTGLSMSMLEVWTCAQDLGLARPTLAETLARYSDDPIQDCLRAFQTSIVFADRTTEFVEQIAEEQNAFIDFAPLSEDDFLRITAQARQGTEVEPDRENPLVAIYPPEGTFWHDYPFAIPVLDDPAWITPEQRQAALRFREYLLTRNVQEQVLLSGFRPVSPDVPLDSPGSYYEDDTPGARSWNSFGVIPEGPTRVFNAPDVSWDLPSADLLEAVQLDWCDVKKRGYIYLVVDASESMLDGNKVLQAAESIRIFLSQIDDTDYVGLKIFSGDVLNEFSVPLALAGQNRDSINDVLERVQAYVIQGDGGGTGLFGPTALYTAIDHTLSELENIEGENTTRTIVLLSDGADNVSGEGSGSQIQRRLMESSEGGNPMMLIAIDYSSEESGTDSLLPELAEASGTDVVDSSPDNIVDIFAQIGSSFATSPRCP